MIIDDHHSITTDHPASNYGAGVLLIDGKGQHAYGPDDSYPESLPELSTALGAPHMSCADAVIAIARRDKIDWAVHPCVLRWIAQSQRSAEYIQALENLCRNKTGDRMKTKSYTDIPPALYSDIGKIALIDTECNPMAIESTVEECLAFCQCCFFTTLDCEGDPRPMTLADCEAIAYRITE